MGPYDVLEEHPRHPRSWSRSRHALTCGSDVSELVWRPVEDGLLYWSPFALLARPLRPPPGRVGPEGPSAEIRAIPDSAPFVLDNPVGFQASPASALPASTIAARPPGSRRSEPCRLPPPSTAAPKSPRFQPWSSDPPHGTLVGSRRRPPPFPLARSRPWVKPPPRDPRVERPRPSDMSPDRRPIFATVPGAAPKRAAHFGETHSRHPRIPLAGPNLPTAREAPPSGPPTRLRSRPASRADPSPRRESGPEPPAPPERNLASFGIVSPSKKALRSRNRPFRPEENAPSRIGS